MLANCNAFHACDSEIPQHSVEFQQTLVLLSWMKHLCFLFTTVRHCCHCYHGLSAVLVTLRILHNATDEHACLNIDTVVKFYQTKTQ